MHLKTRIFLDHHHIVLYLLQYDQKFYLDKMFSHFLPDCQIGAPRDQQYLDKRALTCLCQFVGMKLSDDQMSRLFDQMDTDSSGTVERDGDLVELLSQPDIQYADLQVLHNIGHGSSGVVQKVLHMPSLLAW